MDDRQFQFLLYRTADESVSVNAVVKDETIWLTQKAMAQLFGVEISTINYHLKEIYNSNELSAAATIRKFLIVQIF